MIKLKELTTQERIKISVQCEHFFLVKRENKVFNSVYKEMMEGLPSKYSKEVWLVLTSLIKAVKYGNKGTRFSLNKKNFIVANRIHKQKLSLDRVTKVIDHLDKEGFIVFYKGYRVNDDNSMMSCLMLTGKSSKLIDPVLAHKFGLKREIMEYIEIKDKDDKRILLSIKDFRGYSSLIKSMDKYNTLLSKNIIKVPDLSTGEMIKCSILYKRVFSGDLEGAGRLYEMGNFQTQASHLRKYITINNESTTEVDYSNLHPRLLFTLEGIVLPEDWDAYKIEGLDWVCKDKKGLRLFLKTAYLAVLFSKDKDEACKSVLQKSNKDKYILIKNKKEASFVVESILDKNKGIKDYFFTERLWAKLQNMDSRLSSTIIEHFTEKGIVVLGWHDSYLVSKKHQEELISVMKTAWRDLLGTDINFKYDIEF